MFKISTITGAGVAAVAVGLGLVGGTTVATAAPGGHHQNQDRQGTRVTGSVAQQAIDAALAVVPGTADHVHATADGYRVKVQTVDGNTIIVSVDAAFVVTGQQELRGKVPLTDAQRASAAEAASAAVPGGSVLEVRADRDGGFRVLVRTSEGMKKMVTLDSSYAVTSVKDAKKGHGRGKGRHGKDAQVTGEAYTRAEAAALTAVPGGTVVDVHQRGTVYHVLMKRADGTKVCVTLDADFQVTDTASFRLTTAA